MSRDKIIEFSLWILVPQGRGVAKCNLDHVASRIIRVGYHLLGLL